ncbi:MAG: hypothetical protein PHS44_04665 [Candidatus Dojkabacteria bacterium]|nr:hypothetical protein [Candidatus Dojkabacteria bacterium]
MYNAGITAAAAAAAYRKKQRQEKERKVRIAELTRELKKSHKEYRDHFGKVGEFIIDNNIIKIIGKKKEMLDKIKEEYETVLRKFSGSSPLIEYDKLNVAMSLVKRFSKNPDNNWKEIRKIARNNNIKITELNRTIVAWLMKF